MNDDVKASNCETSEKNHHHHGGKFSKDLLDKKLILNSLSIQPGQTILDAGCGNGYMSKAFSSGVTHRGRVYALDHDKHYIGVLRKETRGTNIEALECDITKPIQMHQPSVDFD